MFMLYDEKTGDKNFYDTKEEVIETLEAFEECGFERNDFTVYVAYTPDEFDCYFQKGDSRGSPFLFTLSARRRPVEAPNYYIMRQTKKSIAFLKILQKKYS